MFRSHLAASGVDDRALVAAAEPSTLAVASLDSDGVASYDFWVSGTAGWHWTAAEFAVPLGEDVVALHTGSMTLEVEPGASLVLDLLRRERAGGRVTISYDPNVRLARLGPADRGRRRVEDVVRLADLVKISADDMAWLYPGEEPGAVARRWLAHAGEHHADAGPSLVVVTLGAAGSPAVTAAGREQRRPAWPVTIVDTVGAGDAFTAGLLDGLAAAGVLGPGGRAALAKLDAAELGALLDSAAVVAGLTCARPGADPPTRAEVMAAVARRVAAPPA